MTDSDSIQSSQPVYAHIAQSNKPGLGDGNVPSNSDREAVLYSDLLSKDNADHTPSNAVNSPEPAVVYGDIAASQEPVLGNANVPSDNSREANDTVLYSDLVGRDNNDHKVAPSGDLYAQVRNRK